MDQKIAIGKIVAAHGVHGEVKVLPLTDYPQRYQHLKKIWIDVKDDYLEIENIREKQELLIIKFTGVNNRDEANKLKNGLLQINRDQTVKLPPGHYYQFQVIGLDVFDSHHNYLGRVSEILETGANDVYIVKSDHKKDLLIPALKSIVLKIDIPHKQMLVELPPGLDE